MNILHCKGRNRLTTTRVNRLLFVQINRRTLNRKEKPQKKDDEQEKEQEDTEDETEDEQEEQQEEQQEEPISDTNEADDVQMESGDELLGL